MLLVRRPHSFGQRHDTERLDVQERYGFGVDSGFVDRVVYSHLDRRDLDDYLKLGNAERRGWCLRPRGARWSRCCVLLDA